MHATLTYPTLPGGRLFTRGNVRGYCFGFNGQMKDDEVYGEGNAYAFEYRIHDSRIGRFLSVDPLAPDYPWNSTYAFAENDVISCIDLEGLEKLSIHLRSFIQAKTIEDPIGRVFEGDDRNATTKENVTARGRAQFTYDFKTGKVNFGEPYANETLRYNLIFDGFTTAVGVVNSRSIVLKVENGVRVGIRYDTKNPLTPSFVTPSVDVEAGYQITFDEKTRSWTVGFKGKTDGYPSAETFVEDESGQRIMLGFKYEEGTPGKKLWGDADTEALNGVVQIFVDDNNNFIDAYLLDGENRIQLEIVKPETPKQ